MAWTDLLPHFPDLLVQTIQETGHQLTITLVSTRLSDICPSCQTCSQAGHGWFTRRIHSLPCSGCAVVFLVQAHRFRCPNPACPRKTFLEDLCALAARYQRRTQAAKGLLHSLGAVAGGQAGARLAREMQLPTSRSTRLALSHPPDHARLRAPLGWWASTILPGQKGADMARSWWIWKPTNSWRSYPTAR